MSRRKYAFYTSFLVGHYSIVNVQKLSQTNNKSYSLVFSALLFHNLITSVSDEDGAVCAPHSVHWTTNKYIPSNLARPPQNGQGFNTIKDYKNTRKYHIGSIMDIQIGQLRQDDIQQAINIEAMKCSPKTVRNINAFLSTVLNVYRPGFSPVITLPKKKRINYNIPVDSDITALMADVKGTEMELPVLLAAFGPMQRGEICALRAENIKGNIVHVCENMVQDNEGGWIIKTPKSYAGDRYIDYPDFVAKLWKGKKKGRVVELTPTALSRRYERIQARMKLKFRFHDLRHYSASIQHAMGIPDAYIMQRGGWSSDGVLKQIYRHALADKSGEMDKKVNDYFTAMQHDATRK